MTAAPAPRPNLRIPLIIIAVVALLGAVIARFVLYPQYAQRIPPGWHWEVDFIGTNSYPDPDTGELTIDVVSNYVRTVEIVPEDAPAGSVMLRDTYEVSDVDTGQVSWIYPFTAPVDPATGMHTSPDYAGDIFVFPRNTQKQNYSFRAGSYEGLDVNFEREEVLEGVTTYVFHYGGYAEYTESYTNATVGEVMTLEDNEEIRCGEDTLSLNLWVEPVTGETVKFEEGCTDGDWVYNTTTGEKVYPLGTWSGSTTGDSVIRRLDEVQNQRNLLVMLSTYVPIGLVVVALVFVVLAFVLKPSAPAPTPPKSA